MVSKKNERNCYLFAVGKCTSKMTPLHTPSGWKRGQKKRAELLPVGSQNLKKSNWRESIAPQIQNGPKWISKKRAFSKNKNSTSHMLSFFEKHEKKRLCSFFSVHLLVFLHFLKMSKIGKNRKNGQKIVFFQVFSYALQHFFSYFRVTHYAYIFTFYASK